MYLVKEHHIKTKVCMEKTNLKPIETYIVIRQLRFLTRIAEMPESRLTRQVVNSQAVSQGKCSRGQQTTKRAYRDALRCAGLCDKKGDIKTSEWVECLTAEETPADIERNLELKPGSFRKRKRKKRKETENNIA